MKSELGRLIVAYVEAACEHAVAEHEASQHDPEWSTATTRRRMQEAAAVLDSVCVQWECLKKAGG